MATNAKNLAELLNTDTTIAVSDVADGSITTAKLADDAVTSAKLGASAVDSTALANDAVVTAKLADSAVTQAKTTGVGRGRNLIINGAMQVAQRDNASGVTSNNYAGPDRMRLMLSSGGTYSISQNSDVPTGQGFYHSYKLNCTTAVSFGGSGDNVHLRMGSLESRDGQQFGYGTSNAKKLTLSFWIKVQYVDTFNIALVNHVSQRSNFRPFTVSAANTWEKVTITYDGDTGSGDGFDTGTGLGMTVDFWLGGGSNFTGGSATANNWDERANNNTSLVAASTKFGTSTNHELYITGIQLELGDQATDFDHMLYGETLSLCQRYYNNNTWSNVARTNAGSELGNHAPWATTMRTTPSCSIANLTGSNGGSPSLTRANVSKVDWYKSRNGNEYISFRVIADAEF